MAARMWHLWDLNGRTESPFKYCSAEVIQSMSNDHILRVLAVNGLGIRFIPQAMQTEPMALCCLLQTPAAYQFLSNRLCADPHISQMAIRGDFNNYFYASKKTKDDPEILLMALLSAGKAGEAFVSNVQPEVLERTIHLALKRLEERLVCRATFATGALQPGILKRLRFHGVHLLKQFNDSILEYAGLLSMQDLYLTSQCIAKVLCVG
jgi:hypothetical protein